MYKTDCHICKMTRPRSSDLVGRPRGFKEVKGFVPWLAQEGPVAVIGILRAVPGAQRGLSRPQNRGFSSDLKKTKWCSLSHRKAAFLQGPWLGVLNFATRGRKRPRILWDHPGHGIVARREV